MARYVAIVDGKPGAFGVVVPDLPGCTSGGETVDWLRNAVERDLWVERAPLDARPVGTLIVRSRRTPRPLTRYTALNLASAAAMRKNRERGLNG